ncbi:MAG: hypothetical protein M5U19_20440 [Microthrixaceae bacterium]|nr:hypothetical protein [Microthrixaceae bacterium]
MDDQVDDENGAMAERLIGSLRDNELSALEAVRQFVDAVDGALPTLVDDGPRRRIIDAAFRMTEQLVNTSNQVALNVVQLTTSAVEGDEKG